MSEIPEIKIDIETITVKGGVRKMTVRNMFYKGFWGKLKCMWYWYWYRSYTISWSSYLNSSVTWEREFPKEIERYNGIDIEAELTAMLQQELRKEMGEEAYQAQQLDIAKQVLDQIDPSWRELQSNRIKEEIDAEILKQLMENKDNWKADE